MFLKFCNNVLIILIDFVVQASIGNGWQKNGSIRQGGWVTNVEIAVSLRWIAKGIKKEKRVSTASHTAFISFSKSKRKALITSYFSLWLLRSFLFALLVFILSFSRASWMASFHLVSTKRQWMLYKEIWRHVRRRTQNWRNVPKIWVKRRCWWYRIFHLHLKTYCTN